MKTVWKGTLSFGLVNISLELYSAVESHSLGFKLLHAKCKTPISYHRWCPHCKKELAWEDIVKGMPLQSGEYFIITPEKLKELKPEKTDRIDVTEFVNLNSISPIYYESHYYALPKKTTDKAYYLFASALEKAKRIAIGRFVMRDKEYTVAIQPYEKGGMLLSTLNYEYEIRESKKLEEVEKEKPKITSKELQLADQLIDKLYVKKFDMSKYKDTFAQELKKAIKAQEKNKKPTKVKKTKKSVKAKDVSLMDTLRASIKQPVAEIRAGR